MLAWVRGCDMFDFPSYLRIFRLDLGDVDFGQNLWIVVWKLKDQFGEVITVFERSDSDLEG